MISGVVDVYLLSLSFPSKRFKKYWKNRKKDRDLQDQQQRRENGEDCVEMRRKKGINRRRKNMSVGAKKKVRFATQPLLPLA
jgi:hypothetical protein